MALYTMETAPGDQLQDTRNYETGFLSWPQTPTQPSDNVLNRSFNMAAVMATMVTSAPATSNFADQKLPKIVPWASVRAQKRDRDGEKADLGR